MNENNSIYQELAEVLIETADEELDGITTVQLEEDALLDYSMLLVAISQIFASYTSERGEGWIDYYSGFDLQNPTRGCYKLELKTNNPQSGKVRARLGLHDNRRKSSGKAKKSDTASTHIQQLLPL